MGDQNSKDCSCSQPIYDENPQQEFQIHEAPLQYQVTTNSQEYSTEIKQIPNNQDLQSTRRVNVFQDQEFGRTLYLKIIASATLQEGLQFRIKPQGISNVVYFGCKYKNKKNGYRINDFKIPCLDKKLSKQNRGQHFYIKYDKSYRIKDMGIGFGCFRKVDAVNLRNNNLITMGQLYLTAQVCYGDELLKLPSFNNLYDVKEFIVCGYPCDREQFLQYSRHQSYLRIQCYGGAAKDDVYVFASQNFLPVTIGRNIDCLIRYYDDELLSKYQCTIIFDGNWILRDGIDGKASMNGIWLYIDTETEIEDGMLIKTNYTILEANYK